MSRFSLLFVIGFSFGDIFAILCTDNLKFCYHSMGNIRLKCPCHLDPIDPYLTILKQGMHFILYFCSNSKSILFAKEKHITIFCIKLSILQSLKCKKMHRRGSGFHSS